MCLMADVAVLQAYCAEIELHCVIMYAFTIRCCVVNVSVKHNNV
jgi:hypothetical protein